MAKRGKRLGINNMWVADFETCTDTRNSDLERVWYAGIMNIGTEEVFYYNNIEQFMAFITSPRRFLKNQNAEIFFHNLKFDGSYILPYLFKEGYTHTEDKPVPGEFSTLIDEMGSWYTITIPVTSKCRITIYDSLKIFPQALEYLPNVYSTPTKKLQETQEFYAKVRNITHKPTTEEQAYLYNDLKVLQETIKMHIGVYGEDFKKTQASQAFYNFEQQFKAWKFRFPGLPTDLDKSIRKAYFGGISYVPKDYAGKDLYYIGVYDINSSYPYQLANKKLPYGLPVLETYGEQPRQRYFWVADCLATFTLKPHKVPCIPKKAVYGRESLDTSEKWLTDSQGVQEISFCSIDWEIIKQSYDIEIITWLGVTHFKHKIHKEVASFINKNNEDKVKYKALANHEQDPQLVAEYLAKSQTAKINNNSFYGKFGEEIVKYSKIPDWHEQVIYTTSQGSEMTEYKRKYLPLAMATTAWGRHQLVTFANILGEFFLYADTDSVHYIRDGGDERLKQAEAAGIIFIDSVKLGGWKLEGNMSRGRYLRPKCYMEQLDGTEHIEVTLAGLPADPHTGMGSKSRSCVTWDNFHIGTEYPPEVSNKLRVHRTPTGNKLIPVGFKITENDMSRF